MEWEREQWIEEYEAGDWISEIAERHQVSRKTVHKWVARYEAYGVEGMAELSRAPHQHPQAVEEVWRERVGAVRQQHPRWGAGKLAWLLKQQHRETVPSESTIGRLLRENGWSRKRRPKAKAHGTARLEQAEQPNQVWGIDFKGWCRTGDGKKCEPLTISDYATRYLLCCQAVNSTRTEVVRPVMERVFGDYGLPERMRSDNGPPFASTGACGLTDLSVWWIELGLQCERIEPGHPQQNGRHERMHRTMQEETMQPPASTWRQQQRRLEAFRREYNEQRPHAALGQQPPATLYRRALREYPRRIAEPEYGPDWQVRKIDGGQARWRSGRMFVSHALNGKMVGFEPVEQDRWKVWFHRHWLGVWDQREQRLYRPHQWKPETTTAQDAALPDSPAGCSGPC
jgi:transposase InsO family protein